MSGASKISARQVILDAALVPELPPLNTPDVGAAWSALFHQELVGVAQLDLEGRLLAANRKYADLAGRSHSELVGLCLTDLCHPDHLTTYVENFHKLRRSGAEFALESRWLHPDGSAAGVNLRVFPVLRVDGEPQFALSLAAELSAYNLTQDHLKLALEAGQIGTWDWDVSTGKLTWSPNLEAIHGLRLDALQGTLDDFQRYIHPDDRPAVVEALERAVHEGSDYGMEYRVIRADDRIAWIESVGRVFRNEEGKAERLAGICRDVTSRKRAEEAARTARHELLLHQSQERQRVEGELEKVRDQLVRQTRMAAIGQLAATIAHDVRNPLSVILNAAYILKRRLSRTAPEHLEAVRMIEEEVAAADRIISNMMEMTRPREPRKQQIDLEATVAEAYAKLSPPSGVQLTCDINVDNVFADPQQLRQLFTNLLLNSIQAMAGCGRIEVQAFRKGDQDVVEVRDTGPGVPPEIQAQLFEPLVTTKAKGTGLGLLICRNIAQRHGGNLEYMDVQPMGAAFRITLPVGVDSGGDA